MIYEWTEILPRKVHIDEQVSYTRAMLSIQIYEILRSLIRLSIWVIHFKHKFMLHNDLSYNFIILTKKKIAMYLEFT